MTLSFLLWSGGSTGCWGCSWSRILPPLRWHAITVWSIRSFITAEQFELWVDLLWSCHWPQLFCGNFCTAPRPCRRVLQLKHILSWWSMSSSIQCSTRYVQPAWLGSSVMVAWNYSENIGWTWEPSLAILWSARSTPTQIHQVACMNGCRGFWRGRGRAAFCVRQAHSKCNPEPKKNGCILCKTKPRFC